MKKFKFFSLSLAVSLVLASGATAAADAGKKPKAAAEDPAKTYELLNLFGEVMERAKASYVEEVDDKKLVESAINGMLSALDPHSNFLDAKDFKHMTEQTQGKFGGLGIEVTMENSVVKVVSPIDDTPAFRAGLKPGDYITNLDGETVVGMTLNEAVEKMRGKPGTKIKLTVRRGAAKPFEVTLAREEIKVQSARSELKEGNIAYIRISSFTDGLDDQVKKAFAKMRAEAAKKDKDAKPAAIVIDVRNNPGGLLDQAVAVSDLFLERGEIVSTRSRNEEDTIKYSAAAGDISNGLPIVVLINGGSASASEIVAGALQDHHRAILLGEKTFGKGSVQTVVPLGNHGAMRLTTARYYTPSGRSIQAKGIEPDVVVRPAKIEELDRIEFGTEAEFGNALKNDGESAAEKKDEKSEGKKAEKKAADEADDYQLIRALELAKSMGLYSSYGRQ